MLYPVLMVMCFNCGRQAERVENRAYVCHCKKCGFLFAANTTAHDDLMANRRRNHPQRSMQSCANQSDLSATREGYALAEAQ